MRYRMHIKAFFIILLFLTVLLCESLSVNDKAWNSDNALMKLKELVEANHFQTDIDEAKISNEAETHFYQRYLISSQWDIDSAYLKLKETIEWRKAENISHYCPDELAMIDDRNTDNNMLGSNATLLRDEHGHPIFFFQFGHAAGMVHKSITREAFMRYLVWQLEKATGLLSEDVDKFVMVLDLQGLSLLQLFSGTNLSIIKDFNRIAATYYPETLQRMVVMNVPSMFSRVW
eukprot:CAMPEP_0178924710 /NCGR_PEP_ID=MMETSP0786-20121207/17478_1 /TAXON_ID=186022 /ORGANISM="Thalassionema frauenfeldii, Strain CCMP 1798" /LENGTH=231 /DNA_ID=CAMNT_0020599451 /DNA_START=153 /DNA_END=845 /DNA_ORIENTATION=-